MNSYITASVFRFDPDKDIEPYYHEYQIKAEERMTILRLLNYIHCEIDPTLSFRRFCCSLYMCRSCVMKINHQKSYACFTEVKPGEKVIIEPITYPDLHIKDLVVKLTDKEMIEL